MRLTTRQAIALGIMHVALAAFLVSFGAAAAEASRVGIHGRGDYSLATGLLCLSFALAAFSVPFVASRR